MVLAKRIIPCLDVNKGRVVKGINFVNLRDAGDPVELGKRYSDEGADELVFLDITASVEKRDFLVELVKAVASEISIPFTIGGGIKSLEDAKMALNNGADKVTINTSAIENPDLITEISDLFGKQCVVVAIDAKRNFNQKITEKSDNTNIVDFWFEIYTYGGRKATGIDAVKWAKKGADLGAGEFLVTSMDKDGTKDGFDVELTSIMTKSVNIPIIASGGAGNPQHFVDIFELADSDAALAASIFHYEEFPISVVKEYLQKNGVIIRK